MSLATIQSRALLGIDAIEVTVETHLSNGLPAFAIVGLPETAVKESKERVRSAIINSGLDFPSRRITVNLAPADLPKAGGRYDLAIALSILIASGQLERSKLQNMEVLGELALDGSIRAVQGVVCSIIAAKKQSNKILLPTANSEELALVAYSQSYSAANLTELVHALTEGLVPTKLYKRKKITSCGLRASHRFSEIKGQAFAKRAVQIAAAGNHNLLMIGPPGSGKTLLANLLIGLLPQLTEEESLEVATIKSVARQQFRQGDWAVRPICSPHHTATSVALVGGGSRASPGEISLAHRGVLFLDELSEFKPSVLDALREPLESGEITVSRANYRVKFPANFQLLAAMNPCPCGYASDPHHECRCTKENIHRYLGKISGPLLDRIDLIIEVPALSQVELLQEADDDQDWVEVCNKIASTRDVQSKRAGKLNSELNITELDKYCQLNEHQRENLARTMDKLSMSSRATHRIIKMSRTIADFDGRAEITEQDLMEAIGYRRCQLSKLLAR
ncbi:MAG: ATP-dependent protease [Pseudohongiella sp.]|nr:MAG: ATP-dependent protease [Pseudohongiella sp.]